jgi:hypothetical protein
MYTIYLFRKNQYDYYKEHFKFDEEIVTYYKYLDTYCMLHNNLHQNIEKFFASKKEVKDFVLSQQTIEDSNIDVEIIFPKDMERAFSSDFNSWYGSYKTKLHAPEVAKEEYIRYHSITPEQHRRNAQTFMATTAIIGANPIGEVFHITNPYKNKKKC